MEGEAAGRRPLLRTIVTAAVPAAERLGEEDWREVLEIIEGSIASRSSRLRAQLALFLRTLDVLALLRWGRRLRSLEPTEARRLLAALECAPLLLLRRGVWGIRTLAFMGYYGRRAASREIGYRAEPGGWSARGGTGDSWPARSGAAPPETDVADMLSAASDDA